MRKHVRETIATIRDAGGSNIRVEEGGRHTRIWFTNADGVECPVTIHRGAIVKSRFAANIRSQIRRLNER
jgi:hypothetical protein